MALRTERGIAQTWAAWGKAFATGFTVTAKAWLVAKLAAGFAIATTCSGRGLGAFLAGAVITAHSHHGAWGGFGFGGRGLRLRNFTCRFRGFIRRAFTRFR